MMTVCAGRLTPQASVAVVQSTCKQLSAPRHPLLQTHMHSNIDRQSYWADIFRFKHTSRSQEALWRLSP